jgi:CHASE2 domain-containing sensor protein
MTKPIRTLLRGFLQGLVVVALLIGLKILLEKSFVVETVEEAMAKLFQHRLEEESRDRVSPVEVVDISALSRVSRITAEGDKPVTDRAKLKRVLLDVADAKPAAIGVDVYFTPAENPKQEDTLPQQDEDFLAQCLDVNDHGIPTFVGIRDSIPRGEDGWLGYPQYGKLGAAVQIPNPDHLGGKRELLLTEVKLPVGDRTVIAESLSKRLRDAYLQKGPKTLLQKRWLGAWLDEHFPALTEDHTETEATPGSEAKISIFPIDFSMVSRWQDNRIPASAVPEKASRLKDKVVLIGRATWGDAQDTFNIPNIGGAVPGVYLQAAATDTLLGARLYRLSDEGRLVADVISALVPLGGVLLIQLLLWRRLSHKGQEALERRLPLVMGAAVLVVAYFWVGWSGIYWTDSVMVALALFLHGPVERTMKAIFGG